ncbi:complement resistance protein TraT [Enterovibrio norvegicus]|uniref:Complement resistance protein TraT n=1 Tax=Enterovibrio norvegicus TaxID=188144 RepID=A0ABV4L522_9GAMM
MHKTHSLGLSLALASIMAISGCSAVTTAVKKRNLEVKTQMSETVWLDPVSIDKRTIFLQVRNTTDKSINLIDGLTNKLSVKGYRVIQDPDLAHYWIQTNILKLDKMDLNEAQGFFSSGYGAGLSGAALGVLATAGFSSHSNTLAAGGLIGAGIGLVADSIVEDVNYSMITDVQIVEKTAGQVQTTEQASIKSGSSSSTQTLLTTVDNKKRFQTRILSNANQVNLEFEEAKPVLIDGLTTSISGMF